MSELVVGLNDPQLRTLQNILQPDGTPFRNRTHFLPWGRGVGKTQFARFVWYVLVAAYDGKARSDGIKQVRGVSILSLCPTLKQWKDINLAGVVEELSPGGKWAFLRAKIDRQSGAIRFPGGSSIIPFPATDYNARTARGMRADVLDAEECDDIEGSVFDGVAVPWLSAVWSLGLVLMRGTPTRGRHGLWYRTLKACRYAERLRKGEVTRNDALEEPIAQALLDIFTTLEPEHWPPGLPRDPEDAAIEVLSGFYGIHATYEDTPETVSALAVARARAETPETTFKREWLADPDAGEGLIYPFEESFHVREPPPDSAFNEFVVGMDHGTIDPGVLLRGGVIGHGQDATLWLLEEWYETNVPNHIWDKRALAWGDAKFWPDNSRLDRVQDLRALGLDVGETDRGPGSIAAGIARVADLLFIRSQEVTGPAFQPIIKRYARLYVSPKCVNTIREFGLYRWIKRADGTFDERPEDRNNHAMDATRYMAIGRFGRMRSGRHTVSR